MPKLYTAQRPGLSVYAPERAHVPSQTLAHSLQYSRRGLLDGDRFRQHLRHLVLHAQPILYTLALRHIDICTDDLNELAVRGEQVMASCRQRFDCPIGKYNFELARVISFVAQRLLNLVPNPVPIVYPLPQGFAAWKPLQRIKSPDPITLVRPIEILHRSRVPDPRTGVAQPLGFRQVGFAAAQRFSPFPHRLLCAHDRCYVAAGAAIPQEFSAAPEHRLAASPHIHGRAVPTHGEIYEVAERLTRIERCPNKPPLLRLGFKVDSVIPPRRADPIGRV